MPRKLIVFSFICLLANFTQAQNKDKSERKQKIEGTVTDFFGVPWEGAIIKLISKGFVYKSSTDGKETKLEKETKTDSNGKYSFINLPEDSYQITLLRSGTTLEETKETGVLFNGDAYNLDFGVEVGAISECQYFITGVVKDTTGKPVKGAKVSAFSAFNQRRFISSLTDSSGAYSIMICGLGDYVVFANTPKYEVKTTNVTFQVPKDYQKRANFILKPLTPERINWRK